MVNRELRILSASPVYPGRGAASYIIVAVEHSGLASRPLSRVSLTVDEALDLAGELLLSANRVREANR